HCEFTPGRLWAKKNVRDWIPDTSFEDLRSFAARVFPHVRLVVPSVVGEPFAYPRFHDFLDLLETYGVRLEAYTNGTYFDDPLLDRTLPITEKLMISMDGATPKTFARLRAGSTLEDVLARLDRIKEWRRGQPRERRPEVAICCVLMRDWIEELPEMVRIARRAEVDGVAFAHVIGFNDRWRRSNLKHAPELSDRMFLEAARLAAELRVRLELPAAFSPAVQAEIESLGVHHLPPAMERVPHVPDLPAPSRRRTHCKYLWRETFVTFNHDVAPCCGQGRPVMGTLDSGEDLQSIWNRPLYAEFRERMAAGDPHPVCKACPFLAMWGGGDYAAADFDRPYGYWAAGKPAR
ncbi:MAG TPA: SPASM domain-containing protein, partial [Planctomycetota bacterium]|nr:SPASM domain-containing protein [Planctomycetota bacterium]